MIRHVSTFREQHRVLALQKFLIPFTHSLVFFSPPTTPQLKMSAEQDIFTLRWPNQLRPQETVPEFDQPRGSHPPTQLTRTRFPYLAT